MSLEIQRRESQGVLILAPSGRLVTGEEVETFRTDVESLISHGRLPMVLDFTGVTYIDSTGLGCLVTLHTKAAKVAGIITMFGLNERGLELMIITKLSTVFRIFENELDAVDACFPNRTARRFDVLDFVQKAKAARKAASS